MRDISIIVKKDLAVGDIIKRIISDPARKGVGKIPYLQKVSLKETYAGKQIPPGHKGLTLSCIYRASDRTLTAQEVDVSHQRVIAILRADFSAQQR